MFDSKILFVLLMIIAGAGMPVQSALNLYLAKWSGSYEFASFISFFIGTMLLFFVVLFFSKISLSNLNFSNTPPLYAWLGGAIGAFAVTMAIISAPKIGMTNLFLSIMAGQILMSFLIDKFGLFGLEAKEISFTKILAVVLVISGVWLYTLER